MMIASIVVVGAFLSFFFALGFSDDYAYLSPYRARPPNLLIFYL
jgi:hypothetical protein